MRIAWVSDDHLLSHSLASKAFLPAYYARLTPKEAERQYAVHRSVVALCRTYVVKHIRSTGLWDLVIHLGDMTSGWQGRGINEPSVRRLVTDSYEEYRSLASNCFVAWGDHDTGFPGEGGLSAESLDACEHIAPLTWHIQDGPLLILGVCAPLYAEYCGQDDDLVQRYRERQQDYVADVLRASRFERWVLCAHNFKLGPLRKIIHPYLSRMTRFVYGDLHAPWIGNVIARVGAFDTLRAKSLLCPAVAPLWWHGGGMLVSETAGDTIRFTRQQVRIPQVLCEEIDAMPFSQFWKAAPLVARFKIERLLGWSS